MKKPYKVLLILVFAVLFASAPSDAWWLWVHGVPVQEGTQLGRLAASIKEIAEQLEMIKQHLAMLKSLKARLMNELGIGQIMEVFAEAQSVLKQAKSLASGIKDFDAAFKIQFPDFGDMKEIIKASEEGQRMDYSGPHVKDQKEGKESLGQGSRNEALFIHVARGYPSR